MVFAMQLVETVRKRKNPPLNPVDTGRKIVGRFANGGALRNNADTVTMEVVVPFGIWEPGIQGMSAVPEDKSLDPTGHGRLDAHGAPIIIHKTDKAQKLGHHRAASVALLRARVGLQKRHATILDGHVPSGQLFLEDAHNALARKKRGRPAKKRLSIQVDNTMG